MEILSGLFLLSVALFIMLNYPFVKLSSSSSSLVQPFVGAFSSPSPSPSVSIPYERPTQICGVDLPDCPEDMKCMNGWCRSTKKPALGKTTLPIVP
jgi:hypothetical protein